MHRLFKTIGRELVCATPYLKGKYLEWEFLRRQQSYKGIYPSFATAQASSSPDKLAGYNHKELARNCEPDLHDLNSADYPVLFWLAPLLGKCSTLFDLGGNIGVAYYAYRRYLAFPAHFRWLVCDVPETAAAGRELAGESGQTQLAFTDQKELAEESDIYFTAGTLQYIEEPFSRILGQLRSKPKHVLVQRVPLCAGPSFITLQNNGKWMVPYQVSNESDFIQGITSLGYDLVDHWTISRSLQVLDSPEHKVTHYHGIYFRAR